MKLTFSSDSFLPYAAMAISTAIRTLALAMAIPMATRTLVVAMAT
jgi:hypothetical protein